MTITSLRARWIFQKQWTLGRKPAEGRGQKQNWTKSLQLQMTDSPTEAPSNATRLYKVCIYGRFFCFVLFFLYFWNVDTAEAARI